MSYCVAQVEAACYKNEATLTAKTQFICMLIYDVTVGKAVEERWQIPRFHLQRNC